jgi:excisionase family DNA binding protein
MSGAERSSELLTVNGVAAELKIGRSTVYEIFERGELAWVQIGARRRVTRAEIERYIADNTRSVSA